MLSRSHPFTHLRRTAIIFAAALVPGIAAVAQAAPDYSGFTAARFIPFVTPMKSENNPSSYEPPALRFTIQGKSYTATMDTGSTGVMLSATSIPGYTPNTACQDPSSYPGWEFLSSSKRLWVGHWIPEEINFFDAQGGTVTATVPVLAVECEAICPHYKEKAAQPVCPGQSLAPAGPEIHYMGVGFGREHDGQPQGTPDKNPLLNIKAIGGTPVKPGTMRSGYVIQPQGVHVGLTTAITSGFAYTPLIRRTLSNEARDWLQAPICVSVHGSSCAQGSVLVDTGIPQMYLSVPRSLPLKASPENQTECILQNGSQVTVRFGAPNDVAFYSFVVGQQNPMQPSKVVLPGYIPPGCTLPATPSSPPSSVHPAFVNTGGNFFQSFNVLFDADGGFFGLRWTGPAGSAQGGLGPGPRTPDTSPEMKGRGPVRASIFPGSRPESDSNRKRASASSRTPAALMPRRSHRTWPSSFSNTCTYSCRPFKRPRARFLSAGAINLTWVPTCSTMTSIGGGSGNVNRT